jgi:urease accessory protein
MSDTADCSQSQEIQDEIVELERRLQVAKARLNQVNHGALSTPPEKLPSSEGRKDCTLEQIPY